MTKGNKRVNKQRAGYAIAVIHPDQVIGFLTASDASVEVYNSYKEAEEAMAIKRTDTRYTWSLPMEIRKYDPRKENVEE